MNGICILVHPANFSDGGFAKSAHLSALLYFFFLSGWVVDFKGLPQHSL